MFPHVDFGGVMNQGVMEAGEDPGLRRLLLPRSALPMLVRNGTENA